MHAEYQKVPLTPAALAQVPLFRNFNTQECKEVMKYCEGRRYPAGRPIIKHNDTTQDVFFLINGRVQAMMLSLSGKVITFQELREGEMFGELSALDGKPRTASVITVVECLVARISGESFRELVCQNRVIGEAAILKLSAMVRFLCTRVAEFYSLPVKDRVHVELLRLALPEARSDNTAVLSPAPTHADLASRIGTHREAVTRELNALARARLVERRGPDLVICDIRQLQRMVEEVLGQNITLTT